MTSDLQVEGINYFIRNAGHFEGSPMTGGLVVFAAGNDNTMVQPSPVNTLMGVKLLEDPENLPRGIYIINGKKRIFK